MMSIMVTTFRLEPRSSVIRGTCERCRVERARPEKLISYHRIILHDPATFPNPSIFNPDRFLDACITKGNDSSDPAAVSTERAVIDSFPTCDPLSVTFGYGRRVCPGRHMADAQIWISVACLLAVFKIGCGEFDEKGRGVKPEGKFTSGLIRYVVIFFRCAVMVLAWTLILCV